MEQSISHFFGVCERAHQAHWYAEPLNVLSNLGFLLVATLIYRYYHRHEDLDRRWIWDIHAMTFLIYIIGINSIIFHSFPSQLTELMDTVPIIMFIIIYFTSVLSRIGKVNVFQGTICLIAFLGFSHMLVAQFPHALNDSIGYLSSMVALIMIALYLHLKARPSSAHFMLAAVIGMVSLFFRSIDSAICDTFPLGSHFVWHSLNATLIYILMKQVIRNVNRVAQLKRMAGDSTQI